MPPRRGEVWLFDLGIAAKTRPVLIVSVEYGDFDRALVTVVPHTTEIRGSALEIAVKVPFLQPGGFLTGCLHVLESVGDSKGRWYMTLG